MCRSLCVCCVEIETSLQIHKDSGHKFCLLKVNCKYLEELVHYITSVSVQWVPGSLSPGVKLIAHVNQLPSLRTYRAVPPLPPFAGVGTFEFWLCLVSHIICSCRELLRLFINSELIKWSGLCDIYEAELKQGSAKYKPTDVFNPNTEEGQKRWKDLRSRVVEHVSTRYFKMCVKK